MEMMELVTWETSSGVIRDEAIVCDCCHETVGDSIKFWLTNDNYDGAGSFFPIICKNCLK